VPCWWVRFANSSSLCISMQLTVAKYISGSQVTETLFPASKGWTTAWQQPKPPKQIRGGGCLSTRANKRGYSCTGSLRRQAFGSSGEWSTHEPIATGQSRVSAATTVVLPNELPTCCYQGASSCLDRCRSTTRVPRPNALIEMSVGLGRVKSS